MKLASFGSNARISGTVYAGQKSVTGAAVQLYAVGETANGSASTPLLRTPAITGSAGQFTLDYTCPSDSTNVYLTAVGGSPELPNQANNPNFAAMAPLGNCGDSKNAPRISVNETSTVAAVYSLVPYMKSYTAIGSDPTNAHALSDAFSTALGLLGTSTASSAAATPAQAGLTEKLRSLANILATCTTTVGGKAGDSSPCGSLFSLATRGDSVPTETIGTVLNIAKSTSVNVYPLYMLASGNGPFQPSLTAAPADWALTLPQTSSPTLSPQAGAYSAVLSVTLSADSNAKIYYTTDGSVPTPTSPLYSGAISLSATATIRAIAVAAGISSLPVSGTYIITHPNVALTPISAVLQPSQSQSFAATVTGSTNGAVRWSTSPSIGSISATGVYTAPAAVSSKQAVNIIATSIADPTVSAVSAITVAPPVQVVLNPASISLQPSQAQSFVAVVTGSSNSAVRWSTSPALGSISSAGVYTAPAAVASAQTVSIVATSIADATVSSVSNVTLVPPVQGPNVTAAPPVQVSLAPASTVLQPQQSQAFAASVSGSTNSMVRWSTSPAIGTISSTGVYTAPAAVLAQQSVTILATSLADSTASAISNVTLVPPPQASNANSATPVQVGLSPASISLQPSQTQAFVANVNGAADPAVSWSLNPAVGSISPGGVYTAPNSSNGSQTVQVIATSVADSTVAAISTVTLASSAGKAWYMAPNGSDVSGDGTQAHPWLTPNHAGLTCGDTITAAPGYYNAMTITATPACSRHDAVWVKCATFDGCRINQDFWTQGGIDVKASYWAFLGWEVTAKSGPYATCFTATPQGTPTPIHDVYFINDIANGCMAGGFVSAPGSSGVDYFVVIADIAYNTAQGSAYCYSGVSDWEPVASDTLPGTHIYVSQVFAWHNLEPATCAGTNSTDGEGIILDTFNGSQTGLPPYTQQAVVENVMTVYNGAYGVLAGGGSGNSSSPMFVRNATAYGNFINTNQNSGFCGQLASFGYPITTAPNANRYTTFTNNLAVASAHHSGCGNNTPHAYFFGNIDGTDSFSGNAGYAPSGQTISYAGRTTGFVSGVNITGIDPVLANPVEPPAPSCSNSSSVIDCMATVIANFKPTNPAFTSYGYQPPSTIPVYNPLFPRWLCGNPNMPSGLVTMGCLPQ